MILPESLREAIEIEVARYPLKEISIAQTMLSERYRGQVARSGPFMESPVQRCAYLAARMPATYAVCVRVLRELQARVPQSTIESILDVGAGPGTASWAAFEIFQFIKSSTMLERDPELIAIGKRLAAKSSQGLLNSALWLQKDIVGAGAFPKSDLCISSYALNEIAPGVLISIVDRCWEGCSKFCAFIEPGTPSGFKTLLSIRQHLISKGAFMVAPCAHMFECPLKPCESLGGSGDARQSLRWCHFSERVERSFIHAYSKGASVGYEDEKFSYLIFSKTPVVLPERVLSHPMKRSGHVSLHLCTNGGVEEHRIVSKRTPEVYKRARKLEWGDCL